MHSAVSTQTRARGGKGESILRRFRSNLKSSVDEAMAEITFEHAALKLNAV